MIWESSLGCLSFTWVPYSWHSVSNRDASLIYWLWLAANLHTQTEVLAHSALGQTQLQW